MNNGWRMCRCLHYILIVKQSTFFSFHRDLQQLLPSSILSSCRWEENLVTSVFHGEQISPILPPSSKLFLKYVSNIPSEMSQCQKNSIVYKQLAEFYFNILELCGKCEECWDISRNLAKIILVSSTALQLSCLPPLGLILLSKPKTHGIARL